MYHRLFDRLGAQPGAQALVAGGYAVTYEELTASMAAWSAKLKSRGIAPGSVVALRGDYGLQSVSAFLALLSGGYVVAALPALDPNLDVLLEISCADFLIDVRTPDQVEVSVLAPGPRPVLLTELARTGRSGLIVFSSGTTGACKAALFDFEVLSRRYASPGRPARTLAFLFLDHLGGVNTLLHTISAGGTLVAAADRSADAIAACIEAQQVDVLPTTPTFLRMLLISGVAARRDLSSLRLITYGTEPMPSSTLDGLRRAFPEVRLKQTYGLSELGVLPTRSPDQASLWMELGGLGCETRVIDGRLQIRSETAMLGYLNAPSPFDPEGWYDTHDLVQTRGGMIRIMGRETDVINVGGEKVHPVEVENVLLQMQNVEDATVNARPSPITGQVVAARVRLCAPESERALIRRLHRHCRERLAPHKCPVFIEVSESPLMGQRLKKLRSHPYLPPLAAS